MLSLGCQVTVYISHKMIYHKAIPKLEDGNMATDKRVFTLRLTDEVFDKIGLLTTNNHRSMTNYIEYVLMQHLENIEREHGVIENNQAV